MERRESRGQEREADGEKTGHQVPQPAEEVAKGQNPVKTGQEEVRNLQRSSLLLRQPPDLQALPRRSALTIRIAHSQSDHQTARLFLFLSSHNGEGQSSC